MLDKKDELLISALKEDASLSTYRLSRKTGIPQTTVLNRIKKLKASGVIKRYTVDLDYKQLGRGLKALIFVKVDKKAEKNKHGSIGRMEASLSKQDMVLNVKRLMGKFDFVVEIVAKDVDELNQFLVSKVRNLEEVSETETLVVLGEWAGR